MMKMSRKRRGAFARNMQQVAGILGEQFQNAK
jgi:hypothetical protein